MRTDSERRKRLNQIMVAHALNSRQIATLVHRNPECVRRYRAGLQPMPECLLRLLELELEYGRAREWVRAQAAG